MASFSVIVKGSKLVIKDNEQFYRCVTIDNKEFWSQQAIPCGEIAQITERKKGDTYTDREGSQQVVKNDGFNCDFHVGGLKDIERLAEAKVALAALMSSI